MTEPTQRDKHPVRRVQRKAAAADAFVRPDDAAETPSAVFERPRNSTGNHLLSRVTFTPAPPLALQFSEYPMPQVSSFEFPQLEPMTMIVHGSKNLPTSRNAGQIRTDRTSDSLSILERTAFTALDRTVSKTDWAAEAAALSRPEAYRLLVHLNDVGAATFASLDEEIDVEGWIGLAQLMRAGYVTEGRARIHITASGRLALERFQKQHPKLPFHGQK